MNASFSLVNIARGVAVVLFALGAYMFISNFERISPESRDTSDLQKLTAIVSDKQVQPQGEESHYELTMEFQFGTGGQKFYTTKSVDRDYFDKVFKGDAIVIYASNLNPSLIVIPDARSAPVSIFNGRLVVSLLFILLAIAIWIYAPRLDSATTAP